MIPWSGVNPFSLVFGTWWKCRKGGRNRRPRGWEEAGDQWEIEAAWHRDEAQPFGPPMTVFTEA